MSLRISEHADVRVQRTPHRAGSLARLVDSPRRRLLYSCVIVLAVLGAIGQDMAFMRTSFVYDVFIYQCYARGFWQGADQAIKSSPATAACKPFWDHKASRFHALPREYPALSLAVFSLPLLTPWLPYNAAFLLWMAFLLLAAACLLAWRGPPWSAIALPLYVLLAGWQFVLARYDLVPGLCILLAAILAYRGRLRTATVLIAVGTLLKIFPVLHRQDVSACNPSSPSSLAMGFSSCSGRGTRWGKGIDGLLSATRRARTGRNPPAPGCIARCCACAGPD